MRIPITVTVAQKEDDRSATYVREVALFGWVVMRQEVYTEGFKPAKAVGFDVFPDESVYVDDNEEL